MERLTRKSSESEMVWFIERENNNRELEPCDMNYYHSGVAIRRLADYEIAEEQGLLLKLPCKVGDKVFVLSGLEDDNIVHEGKCVGYTKNELRGWLIEVNYFGGYKSFESFTEIGKSVFLTKEEAQQKLKEMESGTNGN